MTGEVLTAANLNANFQGLDGRVTALEGRESETSGSRLVARYTTTTQVGADGAQQVTKTFAGWFDTQRNEYCYPTLASDDQQRWELHHGDSPGELRRVHGDDADAVSDGRGRRPNGTRQLTARCPRPGSRSGRA
jgi:hypothetical protein